VRDTGILPVLAVLARARCPCQQRSLIKYNRRMKYRILGKTGLRVSVIGIGTWQLGGEWGKNFSQDEVDRMFRRASELGMNLIDTAECYGDHLSESLIGKAIERNRGDWIVATKFGHHYDGMMQRTE